MEDKMRRIIQGQFVNSPTFVPEIISVIFPNENGLNFKLTNLLQNYKITNTSMQNSHFHI